MEQNPKIPIKRFPAQPADFYLQLQNNTNERQPIILFDLANKFGNINGLNKKSTGYQWDMVEILTESMESSFFGDPYINLVVLAAKNDGNFLYKSYTYTNPSGAFTTIEQVLFGFNSLGLGVFTNPENDVISTSSDEYLFSYATLVPPYPSSASSSSQSCVSGTIIYTENNFGGGLSQIPLSNLFWINSGGGTVNGPNNRSGIFTNPSPSNLTASAVGLFENVYVSTTRTVYFGFTIFYTGDTDFSIYVNNNENVNIFPSVPEEIIANINAQLGTSYSGNLQQFWLIVPIVLEEGNNLVQLKLQDGIYTTGESTIALEIYDNTAEEIAAATSYADLKVLYRSSQYIPNDLF